MEGIFLLENPSLNVRYYVVMAPIAIVAALLQSALIVLQLAQLTPDLPQSVRDNAEQAARQAISAATTILNPQTQTSVTPMNSQPSLGIVGGCNTYPAPQGCAPCLPASIMEGGASNMCFQPVNPAQ